MNRTTILILATIVGLYHSLMAAPQSVSVPQHVTILNMAGVNADVMEQVRAYAEANLYVPVVMTNVPPVKGDDLKAIGEAAAKLKTPADACLVVLAIPSKRSPLHATMLTNAMVTAVNAEMMKCDDAVKYVRRLQRQVMRGTAFLFGIGPDIDPHCVMHDYRTLADLDQMGLNFSPPWGDMFRKAAAERGLVVRPMFRPRPPKPPAK